MDQFDIIGSLKTYVEALGHIFIWQKDQFYANLTSIQEYTPGQLIFVVDLKPTPTMAGNRVSDIVYDGLFMVGRKFDADGTAANLDETQIQKYERRLLALTTSLVTHVSTFACANSLILNIGSIDYGFNLFDSNIDFVMSQGISFTQ